MSNRNRARKRRATPSAAVAAPPAARSAPARARPTQQPKTAAAPAVGFDRLSLIAAGAVALVAFFVYALTVEPSVPTGDSGELITAAAVLGVAHPPGYPLYMILGHLATLVPFGSVALRMNLLSALLDALAVGIVFLVVYRLVAFGRDGARVVSRWWLPVVAGATGALLLAFSSLFWAYSVVAEVFALNNFFAALLLFIGLEWCRRPERMRLLWLFMFLFGLALCNQQTIVLLVPAFAVLAWQGWKLLPRARGALRLSWKQLGIAAGAFAAGLLPYLYLPLAASSSPPLNWGDPTTWSRFYTDVSRGNYGTTTLVAGGQKGSIVENMRLLFGNLASDFVWLGLALAAAGCVWAWRNRRGEGTALFVGFLVAGPLFMAYTDTAFPDSLTKGVVARFYILPSIPLAILAGLGAWWLLHVAEASSRARVVTVLASALLLALPVAALAAHYSGNNQSGNYVAQDYGADVLKNLPPNSLLLMRNDENFTSVSYEQDVEHVRPDVIALDSELLKLPTYVSQQLKEHPGVLIPFTAFDGGVKTSLNTLVSANLPTRPVFYVGQQEEKKFGAPFSKLDEGLVTRLVAKGSAPDQYAAIKGDPALYKSLHFPTHAYPKSSWESTIAADYGSAAFDIAYALDDGQSGDVPAAEQMYRVALLNYPQQPSSYKNLGLLLYEHGGDPKEVVSLWTTYLRLKPGDPQDGQIRTALAKLQAKGS
jgi:4-amino-4-deoxy-L-arabinose transferase-like glycosyltransferase